MQQIAILSLTYFSSKGLGKLTKIKLHNFLIS